MILKTKKGYVVVSKTGKYLSRADLTKEEAEVRMNKLEWYKNIKPKQSSQDSE
jgi:hypothetical protein